MHNLQWYCVYSRNSSETSRSCGKIYESIFFLDFCLSAHFKEKLCLLPVGLLLEMSSKEEQSKKKFLLSSFLM